MEAKGQVESEGRVEAVGPLEAVGQLEVVKQVVASEKWRLWEKLVLCDGWRLQDGTGGGCEIH